jgi:AcrR family transcriptional regulator
MSVDDARSRILAAAGPIFAEKGFKNATVREICQAATVNVASVNYYFGDKERLYVETVKRAHPLHDTPQPAPDWPPGTPPGQKLAACIRAMALPMLGARRERWQAQLLAREMMDPSSACRELVETFFRQRFNVLLETVTEILPAGTPAHRCHLVTLSIVAQFVYFRAGRGVLEMLLGPHEVAEHHRTEQLVDHVIDVSFAMLGLGPPVSEPYVSKTMVESCQRDDRATRLDGTKHAATKA